MNYSIRKFFGDENGAVTVDWVVLTAAIVGLGVMAGVAMTNGTTGLSDDIWLYMTNIDPFS
jgi:Flp pilus assembly pilin Flp